MVSGKRRFSGGSLGGSGKRRFCGGSFGGSKAFGLGTLIFTGIFGPAMALEELEEAEEFLNSLSHKG